MAELKHPHPMDVERFLDWAQHQEHRYELVDGQPVMMAGARARHDNISVNALVALRQKLRGSDCRPYSGDFAIRTHNQNIRRPDVTVDCGPNDPDRLVATNPVFVIEVLSPSTRSFDLLRKADEYRSTQTILYILYLEPDRIAAIFMSRQQDGSLSTIDLNDPDDEITLPHLGISLQLRDFYQGDL